MAIKIITDSTSDILKDEAEKLDIEVLPLHVFFDQDEFIPEITITNEEFYEKLKTVKHLPTTAQVNPERFYNAFKTYTDNGDEIIGLFISSELSGTYQSAIMAKERCESPNIHIIDTKAVTLTLKLMVVTAVKLRDKGVTAAEIIDQLSNITGKIRLFAVIDTLKYLRMGGRLNAATAFVGEMLGIKPIMSVEEGKISSKGKARGFPGAIKEIANMIPKAPIDFSFPIILGQVNNEELFTEFKEFMQNHFNITEFVKSVIGPVVGTHTGPNCVGLAYVEKI